MWPRTLDPDSGTTCSCLAHNSTDGYMAFNSCPYLHNTTGLDIVPYLHNNGSICIDDSNSELNGTVVQFQCSYPCNPMVDDCFINKILSMHKIEILQGMYNVAILGVHIVTS